jgi:hypothetical protein
MHAVVAHVACIPITFRPCALCMHDMSSHSHTISALPPSTLLPCTLLPFCMPINRCSSHPPTDGAVTLQPLPLGSATADASLAAQPLMWPSVCSIFFASGLNTLLQTTWGDRLPIVQGGSFSFLMPAFAVIANVAAQGDFGYAPEAQVCSERFKVRMQHLL